MENTVADIYAIIVLFFLIVFFLMRNLSKKNKNEEDLLIPKKIASWKNGDVLIVKKQNMMCNGYIYLASKNDNILVQKLLNRYKKNNFNIDVISEYELYDEDDIYNPKKEWLRYNMGIDYIWQSGLIEPTVPNRNIEIMESIEIYPESFAHGVINISEISRNARKKNEELRQYVDIFQSKS